LLLLSRTFSAQYLLGIFWGWLMDPCCGLSLWAVQTAHPNWKWKWKWLPVTARIQFKIAALTFDCVRGTGPVYLKQVIRPVSDLSRWSLRSADRGDLFVSRANTSIGQRSFSVAAAVVRSPLNSRRQFRSKLKTHLFRQAYNTA